MPLFGRDQGPLAKYTKEIDVIKKKTDQLVKESNKLVSDKKAKDKEIKLEQLYQNAIDTKTTVSKLYDEVEALTEEQETGKVKNYDQKKSQELERLRIMQTQLSQIMGSLLPGVTEEEFLKKQQKEGDKQEEEEGSEDDDDEEEEDEDDDDEDEEEEEDDEDNEKPVKDAKKPEKPKKVTVRDEDKDIDEEEEDDDEDEEEEEEEESEEETPQPARRAIPEKKAIVKQSVDDDDEDEEEDYDDDDDDEEEEEEEEETDEEEEDESDDKKKEKKDKEKPSHDEDIEVTQSTLHRFVTIDDYEGEEGDLSFSKGTILTIIDTTRNDGWWLAENEEGKKGLVPSTYLQKYNPYEDVQNQEDEEEDDDDVVEGKEKRSGKALWGSIKKSLQETTVSDVLHAMGAVPSGFRLSTLCRKFNEGLTHRLANYLIPKLSQSNLMYKDLFFDPATNKIRSRSTRIERVITIVSCQQIPPPGAGIDVLDRHVRMCLFDGHNILSNIHSVKVQSVDKSQRTWTFNTKVAEIMDPESHAELFVRTNNTTDNIGILFELCISYCRSSTNEKGVFSCGWVHLPLLDPNGVVVMNRSFDLYVNGGTPYEKGVEVDPSISRRRSSLATSNALVSLISGNKQPRLMVKLQVPNKQQKELMDTLPDTVMGSTCLLQLFSYFRQWQADILLRDRLDLESTELIHSPLLKEFPVAADAPDLMRVFRNAWNQRVKAVKKSEKRDEEFMKNLFRLVFLETVYPLIHLATIPPVTYGDVDHEQNRTEHIRSFLEAKRSGKSALAALLSPNLVFEPFSINEVAYSVIGQHCVHKQAQAVEG